MSKGQIFSIDFLIAMVLMVFFLGFLMNLGDLQSYEKKEAGIISELSDRGDAAAITLTNSIEFACKTDTNTFLAYSFDIKKVNIIVLEDLKERIGLFDYNVSLALDGTALPDKDNPHDGKQIYSIDLSVLTCDGNINFKDINACINGLCTGTVENKVFNLKVSR